jgi:hypothetical protein
MVSGIVKLDFLTWLISAFGTYRLTVLISRDLGPFGICSKLREHSKLLKCPYCTSVYTGSLVALGLFFSGFTAPIVLWFILSFSFSAVSIVLDRCFTADWTPK